MEPRNDERQPRDVEILVSDALRFMKEIGYKKQTIAHNRSVWRAFSAFAAAQGFKTISPDLCERFVNAYDSPDEEVRLPMRYDPERVGTLVRMLMEYSIHGCWSWRTCRPKASAFPLPDSLSSALDDFIKYYRESRRLGPKSLRDEKRYLSNFIRYVHANGVRSWTDLRVENLSGYVMSITHLAPKTVRNVTYAMRAFLQYLFMEGVMVEDFSLRLPTMRIPAQRHIPSVWTREEVDKLLAQVDRRSSMGKRDYAILLLAARLGLRAGDIRTLRLENIDWDKAEIALNQDKTGKPLRLPLTEEVGEALIDYLRHGRPQTAYREVFLRMLVPIQPFPDCCCFYNMLAAYIKRAGIKLPKGSRKGLHSLRHTVACRLVEADTPFEIISDILGHAHQESTRIYAKVDLDGLRGAALDPKEVFNG